MFTCLTFVLLLFKSRSGLVATFLTVCLIWLKLCTGFWDQRVSSARSLLVKSKRFCKGTAGLSLNSTDTFHFFGQLLLKSVLSMKLAKAKRFCKGTAGLSAAGGVDTHTTNTCAQVVFDDLHDGVDDDDNASVAGGDAHLFSGVCTWVTLVQKSSWALHIKWLDKVGLCPNAQFYTCKWHNESH